MIALYIFIFFIFCVLLFFSGKWLVDALVKIAKFLGWREFVTAFFVMAFAASLPNLFVGIISALYKIPELSFGDVVGGNLIDLTLVIALSTLFAGGIPAGSRMVQKSAIFTIFIAILPLILIWDGVLGRIDGIILLSYFAFYIFWLFSKGERFRKVYNGEEEKTAPDKNLKFLLKNVGKLLLGIIFLSLAAGVIVKYAIFLSKDLNLPIALIGILIVGLGNAIPETYFTIISAKSGQTWMILGDLMGAIMVPATLVLGIVALIYPIKISDFSVFAVARVFLLLAALFFFFFVRTDRKITKKEALFLLLIYILFLVVEIFTK